MSDAPEAGHVVAEVAVVLLDGEGRVFAGEQLILWDQPDGLAVQAGRVEQVASSRLCSTQAITRRVSS